MRFATLSFCVSILIVVSTGCECAPTRSNNQLRTLAPGESVSLDVRARCFDNHTGIRLEANAKYELQVADDQKWFDGWLPADACGYDTEFLSHFRWVARDPLYDWFTLMAYVDRVPDDRRGVGKLGQFTPKSDGELICYANDALFMYWDNRGALRVTVVRLP